MFSQNQAFKKYLERRDKDIKTEISTETRPTNLFNEKTFYHALIKDLMAAKREIIIYSPYASKFRTDFLRPTIEKLINRNVDVFIFTRPLEEYESIIRPQVEHALKRYEELGVCIFYPGRYIHQKVAIIDREVLWEGSLNILSHRASNEMMRRTVDENSATQVMSYLSLNKKLAETYQQKYEKLYRGLINSSKYDFKMKMKIFLLGLAIPITAWLFVSLISIKPLQVTELLASLIRILLARS